MLRKFKPGQEIVCVSTGVWTRSSNGEVTTGPKENELCVVRDYPFADSPCIRIVGYPWYAAYYDMYFEPVISTEALIKELETITEPQLI